jgi:hypothetical protein
VELIVAPDANSYTLAVCRGCGGETWLPFRHRAGVVDRTTYGNALRHHRPGFTRAGR